MIRLSCKNKGRVGETSSQKEGIFFLAEERRLAMKGKPARKL